jgi:hypothetical protein
VSEHIYDSVIFDDFKECKTSNRCDPVDEDIEFTKKASWGQKGIAQK